jgi:hypothetical protein
MVLQRTSDGPGRDDTLGATTLTIASGHAIDAMRFIVGDFRHVAAVVTTQVPQWLEDISASRRHGAGHILVSGH